MTGILMVINDDDRFLHLIETQFSIFTQLPRYCKSHHRYGCSRLQAQYRDVDSLVTQRLVLITLWGYR